MLTFHYITPREEKELFSTFRGSDYDKAVRLVSEYPEAADGAEAYKNYLWEEHKNHLQDVSAWKEITPTTAEDLTFFSYSSHREKTVLYCVERMAGQFFFNHELWNTEEVQKAYNGARVAGNDFYNQFQDNPDGVADYLDNLQNRDNYGSEKAKIEEAIARGRK